jgi:hypothetical protein
MSEESIGVETMKKVRERESPDHSENLSETIDLNPYIDATISSGNRARAVLALIVIASVMTFSAFWNSRSGSWLNLRRQSVEDAIYWWDAEHKDRETAYQDSTDTAPISSIERGDDQERLYRGQAYVERRHIISRRELEETRKKMDDLRTEQALVFRIPFFGTAFDINDLGVLSGGCFVVLLMWFRFSLLRELSNVSLTFGTAKEMNQLRTCYQRLAMHQVLHTPEILTDLSRRKTRLQGLSDSLPKQLFLLPTVALGLVFLLDLLTSYGAASLTMLQELVLLVCVLFLTLSCLRVSNQISKVWRDTGVEIVSVLKAKQKGEARTCTN